MVGQLTLVGIFVSFFVSIINGENFVWGLDLCGTNRMCIWFFSIKWMSYGQSFCLIALIVGLVVMLSGVLLTLADHVCRRKTKWGIKKR